MIILEASFVVGVYNFRLSKGYRNQQQMSVLYKLDSGKFKQYKKCLDKAGSQKEP